MSPQSTILLVEDSPEVVAVLRPVLERDGHAVIVADSGRAGIEAARRGTPDVVVLDIGLPDTSGLEVCRALRAEGDPLILMLTSRDAVEDRIVGLSAGADDYVTKPFTPAEVALRIAAMLRRRRTPPQDAAEAITVGDLTLDPAAREVSVAGQPVELTRIEFDLLDLLVRHPRQVLGKDQIHEHVWGPNWFTTSHVLDVHVSNLRRKLGDSPREARYVRAVRGVGYRLGPCTAAEDSSEA